MRKLFALGLMLTVAVAIGCDSEKPTAGKIPDSSSGAVMDKAAASPAKPPARQRPSHPLVGQEAPEIEGKDLDGVEFKLSDYRGKVVMLDFYGDW